MIVVTVPVGEIGTGASGTLGPAALTLMPRAALQALVPTLFVAFTNQLYEAPLESAELGVKVHVPVPAAQPAALAVMLWLTATPDVFCTRR